MVVMIEKNLIPGLHDYKKVQIIHKSRVWFIDLGREQKRFLFCVVPCQSANSHAVEFSVLLLYLGTLKNSIKTDLDSDSFKQTRILLKSDFY